MFELRAAAFIALGRIAGLIRRHPEGLAPNPRQMTSKERDWFLDQVGRLHVVCEQLALVTSAQLVTLTVERLKAAATLSWTAPKRDFAHLMEVIEIELNAGLFLIVAPDRIEYWRPEVPPIIQLHFGSASADLVHASICIALESETASVFHSMRALEKGLIALATAVSVPHAFENWHNIIEQIESRVAAMKTLPRGPKKVSDQQFYSEAAKEFMYFKDAWRNHVAHSRATYDFAQAVKIMNHARDFMAHLATKLHE